MNRPRSGNQGGVIGALTFDTSATLLLFVAIAATACLMPAQGDTWWHLREGEVLLSGGAPLKDYFSHTVAGGYWQDREWLSQVLFFAVYKAGGLWLLTLLCAGLVCAAWYAVWRLMEGPVLSRMFVAAVGVVSSSPQWSLRPQVFTLEFVAITTLVVSRSMTTRRAPWLLVPLFLLWANLHAGVFVGLTLLAIAVAWSVVHRTIAETRQLGAVAACACAATAVTPLGPSLWTDTVSAARRMQDVGITEFSVASVTDPALLPFWLLSGALVALMMAARPWLRASPARDFIVVAAVAMLPLGVLAVRNAAIVVLLAVPAVHHLIAHRFEAPHRPQRRERPYANAALLALASILAAVAVGNTWLHRPAQLGWNPVPANVTLAIESCRPSLYNRFEEGGPLIWFARSQRVFVDNRFDPYPTALLREYVNVEATGNYRGLFERFGVNCAALPQRSLVASRLRSDGWLVTAAEGGWTVLERPYVETAGNLAMAGR